MIHSFGVGNFKSFRHYQEVDLKQLNLIFGPNNSGKSSFTQAIALLIEILQNPTKDILIRHGGLRMIANNPDEPIEFRVRYDYNYSIPISSEEFIDDPSDLEFVLEKYYCSTILATYIVGQKNSRIRFFECDRVQKAYYCRDRGLQEVTNGEVKDISQDVLTLEIENEKVVANIGIESGIHKSIRLFSNDDDLLFKSSLVFELHNSNHQNNLYPSDNELIGAQYDSMSQKEPLRVLRKILNELNSWYKPIATDNYRNEQSDNYILNNQSFYPVLNLDYYELAKGDSLKLFTILDDSEVLLNINKILVELGLGLQMKVIPIENSVFPSSKILRFTTKGVKKPLYFQQLGSSIKSLLGHIIVLVSTNRRIVILEEPERNLHPALATLFGKLLATSPEFKFYASAEDPVGFLRNLTLVETHSEHIIKAVQLEVARYNYTKGEAGIDYKNVNIVYVRRDKKSNSSTLRSISLDEAGNFTEQWPDDFFNAGSDLTMERIRMINRS